jgi:hypothetical protein
MTKDQVKEVLDRVLTWPRERQEAAARVLTAMEAQDAGEYRLTDDQLAEVRRRRAKNDPNRIAFDKVFERFRRHGA